MAQRIIFPQWRATNEPTKYPFGQHVSLRNRNGVTLVEGTFIDAALYPVGGGVQLRLSQVDVDHEFVTLYLGDNLNPQLASSTFPLTNPPDDVMFTDAYGRPAGVLISESVRLGIFGTWGTGTFTFDAAATEFVATVCFSTPQIGVRGILLDDGTLLTGPVWLVGGEGVVLRQETVLGVDPATGCASEQSTEVIRVDVVGDPLFRRRLCVPIELFVTPRLLKTLTFTDAKQTVIVGPGPRGDVQVTVNNALASDTVLRVHPTEAGTKFEVVGAMLDS